MPKYITTFFIFTLLVITAVTFSQDKKGYVAGYYNIGNTTASIVWSADGQAFIIYWNNSRNATTLLFREEKPDGTMIYDEFEEDRTTYKGKMVFKDSSFEEGEYTDSAGITVAIKRRG